MTIQEGQLGHVAHHDLLRTRLLGEAARFGQTVNVDGPWAIGDPGHIAAHGQMEAAIKQIAQAGGLTIPELGAAPKLGDSGHIHDHELMEQALDIIRQADAYNEAQGGTVTERWDATAGKMWRTHTFTASGTLTVTKDVGRPWRVLVVGAGNNGGNVNASVRSAHGGAGGHVLDTTATLTVGAKAVVIGTSSGQHSTIDSLTSASGAPGGGGGHPGFTGSDNAGRPGGDGPLSDITGTATRYAGGGGGGGNAELGNGGPGGAGGGGVGGRGSYYDGDQNTGGAPGSPNTGGGGGGAGGNGDRNVHNHSANGGAGGSGIVIVSYEIAPWNAATGGTVSDVENYNGTGERWRVHTFTSSGTLDVSIAAQPFRVLVCGGGGGGGGSNGARHGGGGSGGHWVHDTRALTAGPHTVTIGAGGGRAHYEWESFPGQPSSLGSITANGGAGGTPLSDNSGATHGGNSDITGTAKDYGIGAPANQYWSQVDAAPNTGNGGGGGGSNSFPGLGGGSGIVIVAYRIG